MKSFKRSLFAAGLLIVFCACGLDSLFIHEILLEMPSRPPAWLGLDVLSYELRWNDEEGKERFVVAAEDETVSLRLKRGERKAIRALPRCGEAIFDQAGGLYPFDVRDPENDMPSKKPDRMKLSFQSGYAVAVADVLEAAGRDPLGIPDRKAGSDRWRHRAGSLDLAALEKRSGAYRWKFSLESIPQTIDDGKVAWRCGVVAGKPLLPYRARRR